ncbi:type IV secretion system protein VirB4 [Weissella sp. LMG 11983]|uniref:type IV secretion system protein VirB4 n=1 Tax=Weissella sp. LMG 11983 TaxID=2987700 RepID=UPI0021F90CB3|nr:type IV secretion system protein VirB4 [Weissella sp. LMG 11983]MCW0926313.1 type IV secretion system protein VirB4 [Weissella sp. LMG 11983]
MKNSTRRRLEAAGYDLDFIADVQNDAPIIFHSDYFQLDGAVGTIISIVDYPKTEQAQGWLRSLLGSLNTITQIKIGTENREKIRSALAKAKNASINIATDKFQPEERKVEARDEAAVNGQDLVTVTVGKEHYKRIYIRIMMVDVTLEGLKRRYADFKDKLSDFKPHVFAGEMPNHFQEFFVPAMKVENRALRDRGFPMKTYAFAGTYMFNQTYLNDPRGGYIGVTYQNGEVMFDPSYTDGQRRMTGYNLIVGAERSGKSSLAKKLSRQVFARGDILWIFDKSNEYHRLVDSMHGVHLILDGGSDKAQQNIINLFHVFGTVLDENGNIDEYRSFQQHIEKVKTYYGTINPDASVAELNLLGSLLIEFYHEQGMWPSSPDEHKEDIRVINLDHYPILDDFLSFLHGTTLMSMDFNQEERTRIDAIHSTFTALKQQYSTMVNGETTVPDLSGEQVIRFDTSGLANLDDRVYAAQYFSILSLMNAYVIMNGREQRQRLERGEFTKESVAAGTGPQPRYFWWIQDEADDIFNARNSMGVTFGDRMLAQQAKNNLGIIAIFPRLTNVVPEGTMADLDASRAMKSFFSRFQNHMVFRLSKQDSQKLRKVISPENISDSQMNRLTQIAKGELLLSIVGSQALFVMSTLSKEEEQLFTGGL